VVIEDKPWNSLHDPVFKGFDNPYLKVMKAAVGRLKMGFVLR